MTTERERAQSDDEMTSERPVSTTDSLPDDVRDGDVGQYEDDPTEGHEPTEED
jgi:hypothetical protein